MLDVCVIGAGAGGLCAARHLLRRGDRFNAPVVFELSAVAPRGRHLGLHGGDRLGRAREPDPLQHVQGHEDQPAQGGHAVPGLPFQVREKKHCVEIFPSEFFFCGTGQIQIHTSHTPR